MKKFLVALCVACVMVAFSVNAWSAGTMCHLYDYSPGSGSTQTICSGAIMGNSPTALAASCKTTMGRVLVYNSSSDCSYYSDCSSCDTSSTYPSLVTDIYYRLDRSDGSCSYAWGAKMCCKYGFTASGTGYAYRDCGDTTGSHRVYTCANGYYSSSGLKYVRATTLSIARSELICLKCSDAGGGHGYCQGYTQTTYGCAAGYYKDGSSCVACGSNMTTTSPGATSSSSCVCKAGYYRTSSTATSCYVCPPNTTNHGSGSHVGVASCNVCNTGYYGTVSGTTSDAVVASCKQCPVYGHYVSTANGEITITTKCAHATTRPASTFANTSISDCYMTSNSGSSYTAYMDNSGVFELGATNGIATNWGGACYGNADSFTPDADELCIDSGKYCVWVGGAAGNLDSCSGCVANAATNCLQKSISQEEITRVCTLAAGGNSGTIMCADTEAKANCIRNIMYNCGVDWNWAVVFQY